MTETAPDFSATSRARGVLRSAIRMVSGPERDRSASRQDDVLNVGDDYIMLLIATLTPVGQSFTTFSG